MKTVEQLMARPVITISEAESLRDAIALMQRHRIRHLPVVSSSSLVGILTDRDIKRATPSLLTGVSQEEYDKVLNKTHVGQVMTRNPFTVTPSTSLRDAVKVLLDRRFNGVPVVEDGRLLGMLTATDLLRRLYEMLEE